MPVPPRIEILICYDVRTADILGERRLRRVAKACERFGQRVQKSVFECSVTPTDLERFLMRVVKEIDPSEDSLRVYTLPGSRERIVRVFGLDRRIDFQGPLIV